MLLQNYDVKSKLDGVKEKKKKILPLFLLDFYMKTPPVVLSGGVALVISNF